MPKRARRNPLADHQEWVEHMYNGPYWINRIGLPTLSWWRFRRKHRWLVGFGEVMLGGLVLWKGWPVP